jgi:hypothetical protein
VLAAIEEPRPLRQAHPGRPVAALHRLTRTTFGGFSKEDVDELLESLDTNYLGWSSAIAPVIMGKSGAPSSPGAHQQLLRATRRSSGASPRDVPVGQPRRTLPRVRTRAARAAVHGRRHRAHGGRRVRAPADARQRARHARRHRPLPEPERARGDVAAIKAFL